MNLYNYLIKVKNYNEDDALETVLRYKHGFDIPKEIQEDIKDWSKENA